MNNFTIEIYNHDNKLWEDYTKYAIFPLKTVCLLDEQLDEVSVSLKRVPREHFNPLLLVRITETCFPEAKLSFFTASKKIAQAETPVNYEIVDGRLKQSTTNYYIIANDKGIETPIGVENKNNLQTYDHDLYLIEATKIMEGFIGDNTTVTNALGNNYLGT